MLRGPTGGWPQDPNGRVFTPIYGSWDCNYLACWLAERGHSGDSAQTDIKINDVIADHCGRVFCGTMSDSGTQRMALQS